MKGTAMQTTNKTKAAVAVEPKRGENAKRLLVAAIKITIALSFLVAGLDLAGYIGLAKDAKLVLAALDGITGIWILLSNVR